MARRLVITRGLHFESLQRLVEQRYEHPVFLRNFREFYAKLRNGAEAQRTIAVVYPHIHLWEISPYVSLAREHHIPMIEVLTEHVPTKELAQLLRRSPQELEPSVREMASTPLPEVWGVESITVSRGSDWWKRPVA